MATVSKAAPKMLGNSRTFITRIESGDVASEAAPEAFSAARLAISTPNSAKAASAQTK